MKITAEQAERLCAYFAALSWDSRDIDTEGPPLSDVTGGEWVTGFTEERVQSLIRAFVDSPDNI